MKTRRVALLVPDKIMRIGIEGLLQSDPIITYEVRAYEHFDLFLEDAQQFNLLLLDISGMRMIEIEKCLQQIAIRGLGLKVIIISSQLTVVYVHRVIQLGVQGFIYREDLGEALLNSIDLILRDVTTLSTQALQLLTRSQHLYMVDGIRPLELQILRLTARGETVKQIAAELGVSTRSVYRARDKLREVLDAPSNETLIDAAREQGLLDAQDLVKTGLP